MAQVTKKAIAEAFLAVCEEKPIDKVTVKDVVARCGITRQTFYYHFQDLLDVIEWLMAEHVERLVEQTLAAESPRAAIRVLLSTVEERPAFVEHLMHSRKREEAERIFFAAARSYFLALLQRTPVITRLAADDMDTVLTFYSSAIVGVLIEASHKPNVDLDALADKLWRLLNGSFFAQDENKNETAK